MKVNKEILTAELQKPLFDFQKNCKVSDEMMIEILEELIEALKRKIILKSLTENKKETSKNARK